MVTKKKTRALAVAETEPAAEEIAKSEDTSVIEQPDDDIAPPRRPQWWQRLRKIPWSRKKSRWRSLK